MARLLVTGGAGYIGSHGRLALGAAGHDVVVMDDLRQGQDFLAGDDPLVRCDIGDREAVTRLRGARARSTGSCTLRPTSSCRNPSRIR